MSTLIIAVASQIIESSFMEEARKIEKRFEFIEETLQNKLALQSVDMLDYGIGLRNAAN